MDGARKFKMGHVETTPLSRTVCCPLLGLATTDLSTKFEISTLTHYNDIKVDEKCKNWGGFGD